MTAAAAAAATNGTSGDNSYPPCPLTGLYPTKPNTTFTRCLQAQKATCCSDCSDMRYGLTAVSAKGSTILASIAPQSLVDLLVKSGSDFQLCSIFVKNHKCENMLEAMVCAVSCNPNSGSYVRSTGIGSNASRSITVCDSMASELFEACKDINVPLVQAPLQTILPSKEQLLSTIFGAVASAVGVDNFSVVIDSTDPFCYNGTQDYPPQVLCCDPLVPSADCPCDSVDLKKNPEFKSFIGRSLNAMECGPSISQKTEANKSYISTCLANETLALPSPAAAPPSEEASAGGSPPPSGNSKGKGAAGLLASFLSTVATLSAACSLLLV